jgi:hypothetical protein
MKISACETQKINMPMISRLYSFLERISCGLSATDKVQKERAHRTKPASEFRSLHRGHHLWAMLADEASSEFRSKMTSLQNIVTVEYETGFAWSIATSSRWMAFREVFEPQKTDNIPRLHLVHSNDLKYVAILAVSSTVSFNNLLLEFLSLSVNVRLLE